MFGYIKNIRIFAPVFNKSFINLKINKLCQLE